jgi:hypothetical protein
MVFTAFKSAQGNGTSKQKTKGGKNKLMNMQNNTQNSDLNTQMYKEKYEYEAKQTIK